MNLTRVEALWKLASASNVLMNRMLAGKIEAEDALRSNFILLAAIHQLRES